MSRRSLSVNARLAVNYLAFLSFTSFALYPLCRLLDFGQHGSEASAVNASSFWDWNGQAALVALPVAIIGVAVSSTSYLLSRRGRRAFLAQLLPALILLAPLLFILFRRGHFNASLCIGALYLATGAPFSIWQLRRAYDQISPAVEDAAAIDGSSSWQLNYSVMLPAVAPALTLTAVFSFLIAWIDCLVIGIFWGNRALLPLENLPYPIDRIDFWALSSGAIFVASLLVGFIVLLFGRSTVSDGTAP